MIHSEQFRAALDLGATQGAWTVIDNNGISATVETPTGLRFSFYNGRESGKLQANIAALRGPKGYSTWMSCRESCTESHEIGEALTKSVESLVKRIRSRLTENPEAVASATKHKAYVDALFAVQTKLFANIETAKGLGLRVESEPQSVTQAAFARYKDGKAIVGNVHADGTVYIKVCIPLEKLAALLALVDEG